VQSITVSLPRSGLWYYKRAGLAAAGLPAFSLDVDRGQIALMAELGWSAAGEAIRRDRQAKVSGEAVRQRCPVKLSGEEVVR
jgi:hypothetical protein